MRKQEETLKVRFYLSVWVAQIELSNAWGLCDINHLSEDFVATLLNKLHNYTLKNLNPNQKNFPEIDLEDKKNKIAIQVTSRTDSDKIKDSLEKFKKKYARKYSNGIRFLILKSKKPNFQEKTKKAFMRIYPGFEPKSHILSMAELLQRISDFYDEQPETFREIKELLAKEFADQVPGEEKIPLLERLYENSRRYRERLRGVDGRFKNLDISETILPRQERKRKRKWIDSQVTFELTDHQRNNSISENILSSLPKLWAEDCKHAVLIGEGGMGKTVSLIRLWEKLTDSKSYELGAPVPLFIPLNEWTRPSKNIKSRFIVEMINEKYLGRKPEDEEILDLMKSAENSKNTFVPSVILLLDGFNEIATADRNPLIKEIRDLAESYPDIQMVITSRYDIRDKINGEQFHSLHLLKLSDEKIKKYLDESVKSISPLTRGNCNQRLWELIRNPMMLTIYASTCEVEIKNRDKENFRFKKQVETPGELLWNFIECQVVKEIDSKNKDESIEWFYQFLLRFLLPALGFEMEKISRHYLNSKEIDDVFTKYLDRFSRFDFLGVFRDYRNCMEQIKIIGIGKGDLLVKIEKILKIIVDEFGMLQREGNSFRFLHQNFRDYFAAVHILNEIEIGIEEKKIPVQLKERTFAVYLLRYLGEIEGEHHYQPTLNMLTGWGCKENTQSKLFKMLELCREHFDGSVGFGVWNIIEAWKEVRGELSGLDLSRLDLSAVGLNGVRCSRSCGYKYLSTIFDESLISEDNLFPRGHTGTVNSAVYSPDGKKILSASSDGTVKEWDTATGQCLRTLEGHTDCVNSAVYSPDEEKILSASSDGTIKEWDSKQGQCIRTFQEHESTVNCTVYGPSNKIISASMDRTLKVWNTDSGKCIKTLRGHKDNVYGVSYNANRRKILSASKDETIKEWDVDTGCCLMTFDFDGHTNAVSSVMYNSKGNKVVSASWDTSIKVWDTNTGKTERTLTEHQGWVTSAEFNTDGKKILSASNDGTIKEWDLDSGQCLRTFGSYKGGKVLSAIYSPGGKKILAIYSDYTIIEWDVDPGQCLKIYRGY